MRRIAVIGSPGSGKSTLARQMGQILGIDVIHLDRLYWKPGWVQTDYDDFVAMQKDILQRETWIVDGNYGRSLEVRVTAADTIVFLDLPRTVCCWRIIKRRFERGRPDMPDGCVERIDRDFLEFLRFAWNFPKVNRPGILERISRYGKADALIRLRSRRKVRAFLEELGR